MSKLVQQAVHRQLSGHIHVHNLDNVSQSANKISDLTETALLSITINIDLSLSGGEATTFVFLDLHVSAALDTIDHLVLLHNGLVFVTLT